MSDTKQKMDQLLARLNTLLHNQEVFSQEVSSLKQEIVQLQVELFDEKKKETITEPKKTQKPLEISKDQSPKTPSSPFEVPPTKKSKPKVQSSLTRDLEKFIGENLINKIGIIITVIGVSIGTKYAIDNNLISPLTRIILGYLFGTGLLLVALRLKEKYLNFSAVLLSGAMAIIYFITYAAYTFYSFIPLELTFALMVLITSCTVFAAINYNKQVIAHIGMIGAYAVPFLLGEDPANIKVLLGYVAIINVGLLIVAFKKYWKLLFYVAFALSWIIFFMWFGQENVSVSRSQIGLIFGTVFYLLFYGIFLAYKLIKKEVFTISDIAIVLLNSFIFYGIGYDALNGIEELNIYVGLFTLGNAFIHLIVTLVIHKQNLADRDLEKLITSMVWLFIAIAIPVQFSDSWTTLLWAGQAAILFSIGRLRKNELYEYLSYPVMAIAFFSLLNQWADINYLLDQYNGLIDLRGSLNKLLIGTFAFVIAFGWINSVRLKTPCPNFLKSNQTLQNLVALFISATLLLGIFNGFRIEIDAYWSHIYVISKGLVASQEALSEAFQIPENVLRYKNLWLLNYSMLFVGLLAIVNHLIYKNRLLSQLNLSLNTILVFLFLAIGLYEISELRESFLNNSENSIYFSYAFTIRYLSILALTALLMITNKYIIKHSLKSEYKQPFEILVLIVLCWVLSSELLHWMDLGEAANSYKLGLSIFWGVFSLIVVGFGIWKNKKHFRITAMVLFGITLVKLFFYDIAHLNTISKTVVFVSLGILLLTISFLYNKYTKKLFD